MTSNDFELAINMRIDKCLNTLGVKSNEYSTDSDKLHNFKVAAAIQGCTPITALAGMMVKAYCIGI